MEKGVVFPHLSPISSFPETRKTDRDRCHLWGNFLSSTIMFFFSWWWRGESSFKDGIDLMIPYTFTNFYNSTSKVCLLFDKERMHFAELNAAKLRHFSPIILLPHRHLQNIVH